MVCHNESKEIAAGQALTQVVISGSAPSADAFLKIATEQAGTAAAQRALLQGAAALFGAGKFPEAQAQFQKYLDAHPDGEFSGQALLGVAASIEAQGKTDLAAGAYQKVISTSSDAQVISGAKFGLARIEESQGRLNEAFALYQDVANANPSTSLGSEAAMRSMELKNKLPAPEPAPAPTPAAPIETTMKLTIIGTGYVGLVTGTCFAEVGHRVVCVDNDAAKVKLLQSGGIPIYEPGLDELVRKNVAAGRLEFTSSTAEGVQKSDVIFIAVPTPPQPDGSVDLSFIEKVARDIAAAMTGYKIVVDKSTVPVKTGEKVSETIKRYCKAQVEFDVVSNPEFLREGFAVGDLMKPDRVVIGVRSQRPVAAMREIYQPFNAPIVVTDINSAELIKHAANSFLALKISYINAIANVCEAAGANVQEVANGIGLDERIGRRFLNAGIGFGGSCFPEGFERLHQNRRAGWLRFPAAQGCPAN